jgi:hypothetical protein
MILAYPQLGAVKCHSETYLSPLICSTACPQGAKSWRTEQTD